MSSIFMKTMKRMMVTMMMMMMMTMIKKGKIRLGSNSHKTSVRNVCIIVFETKLMKATNIEPTNIRNCVHCYCIEGSS